MDNALCFLRTLAEFREPYLLLKRYGIPLVPFASILDSEDTKLKYFTAPPVSFAGIGLDFPGRCFK